jgi:hypothetical protein
MKTISGIMSYLSKKEYGESCRQRDLSRNRAGRSAMIAEIIDAFGWDRKHASKALHGKVSRGSEAQKHLLLRSSIPMADYSVRENR